ncbi:metal-dependent hydrolase [Jongsikchunia kroppenstedtii]|uniref:metal-dependent hydrolase n=1 Tax=Jongsikchunia kroppenstedtii TaxID=1121721 RepID=UPI00035FB856|nr:metal-dependent hydrolase [Jongsikchunia kroppenstedtii]
MAMPALDPGPVELHARNVVFDWSETPLHWIPNEPTASNAISVVNMLFPEAERWFIEAYNEALPFVQDDELAATMRGFIGQEAMHAEAHDHAIAEFLEANGIETKAFLAQMEWLFRKLLGPKKAGSAKAKRKQLVERLWLIAAAEHYTAILGNFALNNTWEEHGADPAMMDILRWHGAEEVEHRCVAHDVAVYFGDGYLRRARAMAVILVGLLAVVFRGAAFIGAQDPHYRGAHALLILPRYMKAAHKGLLPSLRSVLFATITYFKPSFSPVEVGSTAQAVAYLAKSPAARRAGHAPRALED